MSSPCPTRIRSTHAEQFIPPKCHIRAPSDIMTFADLSCMAEQAA